MSKYEVGSVVEGKVIKIKPFGAIVSLDDSVQGLVHISQISSSYVQNISDHLNIGDIVKVKVITVDEQQGKISLSIREAMPSDSRPPQPPRRKPSTPGLGERKDTGRKDFRPHFHDGDSAPSYQQNKGVDANSSLEDKLKDWLKQANERQAGLNKRNNKR